MNQVGNLTEEDKSNEFVIKIGDAKRDFLRIHAQLKIAVGEDFENNYQGYEEQLRDLTENCSWKIKLSEKGQ